MKAFLAVSAAPGATHPAAHIPAPSVLDRLAGLAAVTAHRINGGWIGLISPDAGDQVAAPERGFTARLTRAARGGGGDASTAALAAMLGDGRTIDGPGLTDLLPPFAVAHHAGPGTPIILASDWLGLRQLYWWQGDRIAAVSTNALALAALLGTGLDAVSVAIQSAAGYQIGDSTIFRGVTKLAPGCVALLQNGMVTSRRYAEETLALDGPAPSICAVVEEQAEYLRDFQTSYLTDHPDATLQLSGGLDTRMLLSAIPSEMRVGLRAMTIGVHGEAESQIAIRLSAMCGLRHHVHWLDDQPPLDPKTAYRLAVEAAAALDCMASPVALAPLSLVESTLEQGHRISGHGGETTRGLYVGHTVGATVTPRRIEQFVDWRIIANGGVTDALEPGFADSARTALLERVTKCFAGFSTNWQRATDEWYLWQQTQRWSGLQSTVAAVERRMADPMFARRFQQLCLALEPAQRRNSYLTGRLIRRLDPQLAAVPVDSGLVPARLGQRGIATTASVARVTARKLTRQVRRRLGRARLRQLGADGMAALVVKHWRSAPDLTEPLRRTGVVNSAWLDGLLDGRHSGDAPTVALLINLLVATGTAEAGQPRANGFRPVE